MGLAYFVRGREVSREQLEEGFGDGVGKGRSSERREVR